ncbi:MAG: exosome complex protein Rrp42 [Candidatus Geothermarchaeota archaeon]
MRISSLRKRTLKDLILSNNVLSLIKSNKRVDGRGLLEYRDIRIETNVIKRAFGSAKVELGKTVVLAGISFEVGTPFRDSPAEGVLIVEGEFLPIASLEVEVGPFDEVGIEVSRYVDRSLRKSGMIDLKKLTIVPGELVLKMYIDFNVINDDGNVIDASILAAITSLYTGHMPDPNYLANAVKNTDFSSLELSTIPKVPIPVNELPISVLLALIDDKFVVDPCSVEEDVADTVIAITHTAKNEICAIQLIKGSLTYDQIFEALNISLNVSAELRNRISKVLKVPFP